MYSYNLYEYKSQQANVGEKNANGSSCYTMPVRITFLVSKVVSKGTFQKSNWPAGPRPDWSFWKWNRLFPRVFDEKPFPLCMPFRIWPIRLLCLKVKFSLRWECPGWSVQTNGEQPKISRYWLTLEVPRVTKINFLLTTLINRQEIWL